LDFPVIAGRQERLWQLVRTMAEDVVDAGGRFYAAKDAAIPGELYRASFREDQVERLLALKAELDPQALLRTALGDRLLEAWQ